MVAPVRLLVLERLKAELEAQLADVHAWIQEVNEGIRRESRRGERSLARKGQPPTSGSRGSAKGASKATQPVKVKGAHTKSGGQSRPGGVKAPPGARAKKGACTAPVVNLARRGNCTLMSLLADHKGPSLCGRCNRVVRGKPGGAGHTYKPGCALNGAPKSTRGRWAA